jgi:hypothetical protein
MGDNLSKGLIDNSVKSVDDAFNDLDISTDESNKQVANEAKNDSSLHVVVTGSENNKTPDKIVTTLTPADRDLAVKLGLVPKPYRDAAFDLDRIKRNLKAQYKRLNRLYQIRRIDDYISVCTEILTSIRLKQLPKRSYLIGAPNSFGKSSLVYECLMTLLKQGYRVAPYISLWELAQIRVDNEQRIMNPYRMFNDPNKKDSNYKYTEPNKTVGTVKDPQIITGSYSYSEYINADCLFVHFTDIISKNIESRTLYQLLSIRGAKGLPTIVMTSESIEPYENDRDLKEQVWNEIKAYKEDKDVYDRVYHVSCFRVKKDPKMVASEDESMDNETGVVREKIR